MTQYRRAHGADRAKECPEKTDVNRESEYLVPLAEMRQASHPSDQFVDGASFGHQECNLANEHAGKHAALILPPREQARPEACPRHQLMSAPQIRELLSRSATTGYGMPPFQAKGTETTVASQ